MRLVKKYKKQPSPISFKLYFFFLLFIFYSYLSVAMGWKADQWLVGLIASRAVQEGAATALRIYPVTDILNILLVYPVMMAVYSYFWRLYKGEAAALDMGVWLKKNRRKQLLGLMIASLVCRLFLAARAVMAYFQMRSLLFVMLLLLLCAVMFEYLIRLIMVLWAEQPERSLEDCIKEIQNNMSRLLVNTLKVGLVWGTLLVFFYAISIYVTTKLFGWTQDFTYITVQYFLNNFAFGFGPMISIVMYWLNIQIVVRSRFEQKYRWQ